MKCDHIRLLALVLVLTMCLGLLCGCKNEESQTGLKDHLGGQEETTTESQPEEDQEPATPSAPDGEQVPPGWHVDDAGNVYYYEEGAPVTGLRLFSESGFYIDREFVPGWYYFDETGVMQSATWIEYEGNAHYFTENGTAAAAGWYSDETGWYCLGEQGRLFRSENFSSFGTEYYVNERGYLYQIRYAVVTCALEKGTINSAPNQEYLVPETPVENCTALTFKLSGGEQQAGTDPSGWPGSIFVRTNGEWVQLSIGNDKDCTVSVAPDGGFTVHFSSSISFDAFYARHNLLGNTLEPALGNVTVNFG